jgi:predicted transcriptional regulator
VNPRLHEAVFYLRTQPRDDALQRINNPIDGATWQQSLYILRYGVDGRSV